MPGWLMPPSSTLVVSYQYKPPPTLHYSFPIGMFRCETCNLGLVDVASFLSWFTVKRWALLGQKSQIEAIKSCTYNQPAAPLQH